MTDRLKNGAGWPLEKDASGTKAPNALAGLRNQVRLIRREAAAGNMREVELQLDALLDDLSGRDVAFDWNGGASEQRRMTANAAAEHERQEELTRRGIAEYCAAGLAD